MLVLSRLSRLLISPNKPICHSPVTAGRKTMPTIRKRGTLGKLRCAARAIPHCPSRSPRKPMLLLGPGRRRRDGVARSGMDLPATRMSQPMFASNAAPQAGTERVPACGCGNSRRWRVMAVSLFAELLCCCRPIEFDETILIHFAGGLGMRSCHQSCPAAPRGRYQR